MFAFSPDGELYILDVLSSLYRVRDGNLEFVELYNTSSTPIDLTDNPRSRPWVGDYDGDG